MKKTVRKCLSGKPSRSLSVEEQNITCSSLCEGGLETHQFKGNVRVGWSRVPLQSDNKLFAGAASTTQPVHVDTKSKVCIPKTTASCANEHVKCDVKRSEKSYRSESGRFSPDCTGCFTTTSSATEIAGHIRLETDVDTFKVDVLHSTEWVRMKLVECSPNAFEIGRNLKEAIKWQKKHQDLLFQIKEKDEVVMTLLKKEQRDNLINDSSQHYAMNGSDAGSSEERKMHRAMSNSLSDLWKDLNALLARRHILLNTSVNFYSACNEFGNQLTCLEQYLHWKELPADTATAKSLIHTLEEMHNQMLGSSTACLHRGRELMDMLKTHKANHPDRHKASFGSSCAAIECTLESLVERRNQVEFAYNKRKQELEHALKIRQWEDEVDQVAGWFEVTRTTKLEDNSLGVNQSNTEAMLIHLEQVKENAQERLERAKRLIGRANAELKAFGSDPVAIQSQDLDLVGEGFMKCVDKRKSELGSVVKFYQFVKECETSLLALGEKLELRKFSSDPEVAQAQKENFLTCIKAASDPALNRADAILQRRGERKDGAEGVIDARDRVMEQRNLLLNVIKRYSDDSSRINEMYNLFCKSAQELQDWINTVAVGMLTTNGNLGKTEENASQFLVWHKLLLQDIERKSSELESLVQTANLLLEAGAARSTTVKEHVEEIKSNWAALNKRVSRRIALAEEFTDFLDKANKLFCEIEKLKETVEHDRNCLPQNLTRNHIDELGDDIRSVQTRCVDIMEEANCLNGKLREGVPEDAFDATSAIEGVTELVALLHLIKSELTDTWLSWRYKAGVDKETTAQAKTAEQTINRMMASLENLERSVFLEERVMLGHDADSNQELLDVLEQRQALLESIHKEIEKAVEHSEILGMRIPESPKGSSETNLGESPLRNMVKALLARYHMLDSRLRNYKKALQVAAECILNIAVLQKALIDSERDLIQRQSLRNKTDQTTGVKKQSILSALIRGHDRTKEQMEELMKTISSEFNEIHQIIRRHELGQLPKSGGDEPTLNEFVQELTTSYERWLQLWRTYRDDLVRQRSSSSVLNDIMKHRDGLIPLHKKLRSLQLKISKCQDQEHASLLITEATELNDTAMTAILKWDEFKSGLSATSAREVKDSLQETHEFVYKLSQDSLKSIRSAKILLKFFELTEECESWNDKIKSMISSIRRKAASIKTSKEAKDLGKLFDTSVVEPFEERSNRVLEFASIIVEAERNDLDVSPEDNIESSNDQSLRAVMKNKQNDISASVNTLRYEIDVLNEVLNGVRHKANYPEVTTTLDDESSDYTAVQTCGYGQTTHNVKPYDLSRLYDKNLEKKSENEFPQPPTPEELKLATDNTGTHKQEEKEDTFFDESDSSSSASTSSSDEYLLPHDNETATAFEKDDPILTARKVHSDSDKDESDFSELLKDFVQVDTSSRSSDLSSALTSSSSFTSISTNSKGQVPPPKPPRKKNQKPLQRGKFWERELDQYESFQFPETAGKYASRETNSYLGQEAVKDASDKVHSLYA
ncbi:unnamed protein product [Clavelina lepadiformis]|uniref:Uncharacterized protein n=1 Tax=Clavelina lepadiformis TaxID=159417 RepID=A0ABP0F546_CLALP